MIDFGDYIESALDFSKKSFDLSVDEIDMDIRHVIESANIQVKKFNLKEYEGAMLYESNMGYSDKSVFFENVNDGVVGSISKGITKVIEAIQKFFKDLKNKIISIFQKKEVENNIDKLEKKVKLPFFSKKKVVVKDCEGERKFLDKLNSKIDAIIQKAKKGVATTEEIDELEETFMNRHKNKIIGGTVVMSAAAALAIVKQKMKSMSGDVDRIEKDATKLISSVQKDVRSLTSPVDVAIVNRALRLKANLTKELGSNAVEYPIALVGSLKKGTSGTSDEDIDTGTVESEQYLGDDDLYNESGYDDFLNDNNLSNINFDFIN